MLYVKCYMKNVKYVMRWYQMCVIRLEQGWGKADVASLSCRRHTCGGTGHRNPHKDTNTNTQIYKCTKSLRHTHVVAHRLLHAGNSSHKYINKQIHKHAKTHLCMSKHTLMIKTMMMSMVVMMMESKMQLMTHACIKTQTNKYTTRKNTCWWLRIYGGDNDGKPDATNDCADD